MQISADSVIIIWPKEEVLYLNQKKQRATTIFALLYGMAMLFLLFLRAPRITELPYVQQLRQHLNPVPLHTIRHYLWIFQHSKSPHILQYAVVNFCGNIFLFLPLGFFPPMLGNQFRKFWKTVLLAASVMIIVELLQMLLLVGTCDIDDVILNVTGASIGYGIYKLASRKAAAES